MLIDSVETIYDMNDANAIGSHGNDFLYYIAHKSEFKGPLIETEQLILDVTVSEKLTLGAASGSSRGKMTIQDPAPLERVEALTGVLQGREFVELGFDGFLKKKDSDGKVFMDLISNFKLDSDMVIKSLQTQEMLGLGMDEKEASALLKIETVNDTQDALFALVEEYMSIRVNKASWNNFLKESYNDYERALKAKRI